MTTGGRMEYVDVAEVFRRTLDAWKDDYLEPRLSSMVTRLEAVETQVKLTNGRLGTLEVDKVQRDAVAAERLLHDSRTGMRTGAIIGVTTALATLIGGGASLLTIWLHT